VSYDVNKTAVGLALIQTASCCSRACKFVRSAWD